MCSRRDERKGEVFVMGARVRAMCWLWGEVEDEMLVVGRGLGVGGGTRF